MYFHLQLLRIDLLTSFYCSAYEAQKHSLFSYLGILGDNYF